MDISTGIKIIIIYFQTMLNLLFIVKATSWASLDLFHPIKNYNKWTQFNWFGIVSLTMILNIVLFPYSILYWVHKLFTVGRRK